jgi:hypothetical protein
MIETSTLQSSTILSTLGTSGKNASVPQILEEDEIRQIYRDRSTEDALDETDENQAAEVEEGDEAQEEDEVVRAANANRSQTH